jgi:amino acid permease
MAGPDELGVAQTEVTSKQDVVVGDKAEELDVTANGTIVDHGLHRALKRRHLEMIALGGVIG